MEREYGLLTTERNEDLVKASRKLANKLLCTVKHDPDAPDEVKTKANNIIGSNLKGYSPSLMEKMVYLFKKMMGKFKNIRNSASHYGVEWNEGYEIYFHLVLLVYYAIMERGGFGIRETTGILSGLFFYRF